MSNIQFYFYMNELNNIYRIQIEVTKMGDKEIKVFLKEAREQIKNKEFKNALKECKKVLNKDKNNYMALVFCGLSLSELDQPDQALQVKGWEGAEFGYFIIDFFLGIQKSYWVYSRPGCWLGGIAEVLWKAEWQEACWPPHGSSTETGGIL